MIKIYKISLFLILFASITSVFAQRGDRNFKMPEGNGNIIGTVLDKDNNQAIHGATITIYKSKDSTKVGGAETDKSGGFNSEVPYGRYYLEVSLVGYGTKTITGILVTPKQQQVTLDTIKIKQGVTTEEIEVTAEKSLIEFTPEKKIFNVSESPLVNNGSATDVLKNVPSVSVDNDGNVSLRGSQNVRILVDGRPLFDDAANTLEAIPASSVESIELITNPSAKFEAEGETGFINVVLKKSDDVGYNGTLTLSMGDKDKYNASGSLNLKTKKINLFGNYSFRSSRFEMSETSERINTLSNTSYLLNQPQDGNFKMLSNLVKAGLDYKLTDKQTLSLSSTVSFRNRARNEYTDNYTYDILNNLYSRTLSNNYNSEKGTNFSVVMDYAAKFKQPQQQLSMEASYNHGYEDEPENIINQYFIINYNPVTTPNGQQYIDQVHQNNFLIFSADYSQPFGKNSKLDVGLKSTYRYTNPTYYSEHLDSLDNIWIVDGNLNNEFKYKESISGLYATYSSEFGNLGITAGIRTEVTYTKGDLLNDPTQNFTKKYIDFFPSASISEKLNKDNEFQVSYTRRLNRPRPGMLNPFREVSDPYDIRQGNPNLNPEYIDAYELSYLRYFKGALITSSVFFRQTHGLISRYRTLLDSVTSLIMPVNLSKANSYGFELIANLQTPKWLNLNGSFTYYKTEIQGNNIEAELSNSGYTWNTKFLATVKMWLGLELSMVYNYNSKRPIVDGFIEPMQNFDISIKKVFLDKKLDMSMRVSDLFNTQKFQINTANTGYSQNFTNKRESRVAYLTLTYRFGNQMENHKNGQRKKEDEDTSPPDNEY